MKKRPRTTAAKLLNYKEKQYIFKNIHHLKDTNIHIYMKFFQKNES